jgi:hypothetical protein
MKDSAAALQEIVGEADTLIRRRLEDINLAVPHIVMAVTPEGEVVLHANVAPEVLRAFADDLKSVADEMAAPPEPGYTTH